MTTNVMVRDLDLPRLDATDGRRLEVVVDGLLLFGGSQLAVDTTLVRSLHSDGSPHNGAADRWRDLPSGQAAQRAKMPRIGGTWQSRAPYRVGCGRGWQVAGGEGKSSTRTTSPAEEGRAGLEDEVGSHSLLRSCEGSRKSVCS